MGNKKSNSLVKNASILMIATMVSRIIGLLYRRPLGQALGDVGLGYYGYASDLYVILLLISSYSIPMAVSKVVSERLALKEYKNAHKIFQGALLYAALIGGATALITFFFGGYLLPHNQQNALPALRVLAPTIFISAILGVFRGYFQAHNTMIPTSISQIAEQIMNAIVSVFAGWAFIVYLTPAGGNAAIYGAAGGTLGTGAGVLTGLAFMLIVYAYNRKAIMRQVAHDHTVREESYRSVFRLIFMMVTPIIFTTFIYNASAYLNSYLFSNILGWRGIASEALSSAYGELSQYYTPLINIPVALASASASAMMPEVSGCFAKGDKESANSRINSAIRLTMFLCVPAAVGLAVLAGPIIQTLFPAATNLGGYLLMTGAFTVIFSALSTITNSVLQSIGKQKIALRNAGISLVVNLVFLTILLLLFPGLGVFSIIIANYVFYICMSVLNALSLKKYLDYKNELMEAYGKPFAAAAGMGLAAWIVYYGFYVLLGKGTRIIPLGLAMVIAVILYMILFVKITKTPESAMLRFPMGSKIVKVLKLLHIY
ncbi:MAG: polysaccharide biosynthesis protein [Lachnospiraceae bacterium]|nr:polysaccharide biosynthesis protein [Lachnospiraceae bacterium]